MDDFEWLSSNVLTAYPFDTRQTDDVHTLFVDAYVAHNKYRDKSGKIKLYEFDPGEGSSSSSSSSSSGSTRSAKVTFKFEDGTILAAMDSATDTFKESVLGEYTIYEWRRRTLLPIPPNVIMNPPTAGFTDEDIDVKVVVLTAHLANFSYPLYPAEGYMVASLIDPRAKGVRRMFVRLPDLTVPPNTIQFYEALGENVVFKGGTNVVINKLTAAQAGITQAARKKTVASLEVVPGTGAGYYISCDPSLRPGIRTINKVPPNKLGNLGLEGEQCLWTETLLSNVLSPTPVYPNTDYLAELQPGLVALHNSCQACCDCADYVEVYEAMRRLWERALAVSRSLEAARKTYNALTFQVRDLCKRFGFGSSPIKPLLFVKPHPDYRISVSLLMLNATGTQGGLAAQDITSVSVRFKFTSQPGLHAVPDHGVLTVTGQASQLLLPIVSDTYVSPTEAYSTAELGIGTIPKEGVAGYSFEGRFDEVGAFPRNGKVILVEAEIDAASPTMSTVLISAGATLQGPEELT